jgi:hypothetical protein
VTKCRVDVSRIEALRIRIRIVTTSKMAAFNWSFCTETENPGRSSSVTLLSCRDTFILRFLHENKVDVWQGTNVGRWREISHECAGYTGYQRSHSTTTHDDSLQSKDNVFRPLLNVAKREGNSDLLDDLSENVLIGSNRRHNLKWHCLL